MFNILITLLSLSSNQINPVFDTVYVDNPSPISWKIDNYHNYSYLFLFHKKSDSIFGDTLSTFDNLKPILNHSTTEHNYTWTPPHELNTYNLTDDIFKFVLTNNPNPLSHSIDTKHTFFYLQSNPFTIVSNMNISFPHTYFNTTQSHNLIINGFSKNYTLHLQYYNASWKNHSIINTDLSSCVYGRRRRSCVGGRRRRSCVYGRHRRSYCHCCLTLDTELELYSYPLRFKIHEQSPYIYRTSNTFYQSTPSPTQHPTPSPTQHPTPSPTQHPTQHPTPSPIQHPTPSPTKLLTSYEKNSTYNKTYNSTNHVTNEKNNDYDNILIYCMIVIIGCVCLFILLLGFLKNNRFNPKVGSDNENGTCKENPSYESDESTSTSTTSTTSTLANKTSNRIFVNDTYVDPHDIHGSGIVH